MGNRKQFRVSCSGQMEQCVCIFNTSPLVLRLSSLDSVTCMTRVLRIRRYGVTGSYSCVNVSSWYDM